MNKTLSKETALDLIDALEHAILHAGFHLCGPGDFRAAEDGEPMWVCKARRAISRAQHSLK